MFFLGIKDSNQLILTDYSATKAYAAHSVMQRVLVITSWQRFTWLLKAL
jgi:hypothetical protein